MKHVYHVYTNANVHVCVDLVHRVHHHYHHQPTQFLPTMHAGLLTSMATLPSTTTSALYYTTMAGATPAHVLPVLLSTVHLMWGVLGPVLAGLRRMRGRMWWWSCACCFCVLHRVCLEGGILDLCVG